MNGALRVSPRGVGLVEVMVTVAVIALLMVLAAPSVARTIEALRGRSVVARFVDDLAWARGRAATTDDAVSLTLNPDCSWTATSTEDAAAHSMSAAALASSRAGLSCTGVGGTDLPVTFTFTRTGTLAGSASVTFSSSTQDWPLKVRTSGAVTLMKGAS